MYKDLDDLKNVYIGNYTDWNTTTNEKEIKTLIAAPIFLVTQDPLSGGTGEKVQTFYIGISLLKIDLDIPLLDM